MAGNCLHTAREVGESAAFQSDTGYRRQIKWNRFPSQKRFDELDVLVKGFSAPLGSGKSRALAYEAIKLSYLNPGCMGLIGAPTYSMLLSSTLVELEQLLIEHQIPHLVRHGTTNMQVHLLEPNSTILLRSLDIPERLRGMNLAWFGVDELTYCHEDAWTRLQGRLRHPASRVKRAFGVWTPKGRDWVWRVFKSSNKVEHFHLIEARPFENRVVLQHTPEYYENLRRQYDEKFYRQEVLGEYLDMFAGAVYHAFSATETVLPHIDFDPSLPCIACVDFNINPMTAVLAQEHMEFGRARVVVLREIALRESHVLSMCEEFIRRTSDWQRALGHPLEIHWYGDATGGNPHASGSGETCWSLIEKFFSRQTSYRSKYFYGRSNPTVVDRVNAVNNALCSFGEGHRRAGHRSLFVAAECKQLNMDFEQVVWKTDANGLMHPEIDKKRDPKRSHLSDALGYFIWSRFAVSSSQARALSSSF
jgi:hypothetical protein